MRPIPLTVLKGGINRLRTKGGARADTLYDLVNGRLTDAGTVKCRPGTIRTATLNSLTRGLCAFNDTFHVFCHIIVDVPAGFTLKVIVHPDATAAAPIALSRIHFAAPFLGFLYVVAEFEDGNVYHYWLSSSGTWAASTMYRNGDIVEPTTPNGLAYQAIRISSPFPSWAPNVIRADGDIVEPTVYNDFYYTVVATLGDNPHSGTTEPTWPTTSGSQVTEDSNGLLDSSVTVTQPEVDNTVPTSVSDRYGS